MSADETELDFVLRSLIEDGRAAPREDGPPPWLQSWGPKVHDDFLTIYRRIAPGPIGRSGARLLASPERLGRLKPDWRVSAKSEFLGFIENAHGGMLAWWLREGGWVLVELYPGSIHPRDLDHLGLAGWLREELEGEGVQEVTLTPIWSRMTLIMFVIGAIGLVLSAVLMFVFADVAQEQAS